ncbi:MAG: hypothetical protein RLY66_588 [Candidatus Parcubacteria bacterium]|jgi:hypothetical protein
MNMHIKKQGEGKIWEKGYTLLFAVIAASLVLSVGVFILGVSKKQFALSVAARESMYALYAADSAIECVAREYNYNIALGSGLSPTEEDGTTSRAPTMECNNDTHQGEVFAEVAEPDEDLWSTSAPVIESSNMHIPLGYAGQINPPCAVVTIAYGTDTEGDSKARMEARGYNQCDSSGVPLLSSRTVERALRLSTTY